MNAPTVATLLVRLKTEVIDKAKHVDPDDERDWESLILGWAIAKGLPIKEAKRFASSAERAVGELGLHQGVIEVQSNLQPRRTSMTKTERVIAFVKASPTGRRFGEIQRFIVEMKGYDYDEKRVVNQWQVTNQGAKPKLARRWRGYWCTYLLGGGCFGVYGPGALKNGGCVKVGNQWVYKAT